MEILNIIFTGIGVLLGFPVGLWLARITHEEIKAGKRYFYLLQDIFMILALIAVIYSFKLNIFLSFLMGLLFTLLILKLNLKPIIAYPIFIILFLLSIDNFNILILVSSLTFLYGFPAAALMRLKR